MKLRWWFFDFIRGIFHSPAIKCTPIKREEKRAKNNDGEYTRRRSMCNIRNNENKINLYVQFIWLRMTWLTYIFRAVSSLLPLCSVVRCYTRIIVTVFTVYIIVIANFIGHNDQRVYLLLLHIIPMETNRCK